MRSELLVMSAALTRSDTHLWVVFSCCGTSRSVAAVVSKG